MGIRIIRPYGRSVVGTRQSDKNKPDPSRKLHPKNPDSSGDTQEISQHAQNKDELVIAQWISAIDKIASKPFGAKRATKEQKELRRKLGDAAWCLLEQKPLLPGLADDKKKPELEKTWEWKLHPYGCKVWKSDKKQTKPPEAKGRWYKRFAGDTNPDQIDEDRAKEIADKIHEDLYKGQFSFTADKQPSGSVQEPQGRIVLRASSIEKNVLVKQREKRHDKPVWDNKDKKAYEEAGDVAACIYAKIKVSKRKSRLYVECAAEPLHDHYGKLFQDEHKKFLHVGEASTRHPGLFALHQAVKHTCKSLLEGRRRSKKALEDAFPETIDELLRLVEKRRDNQDINALIRLGRIIHYQAMHDADKPGQNRPLAPVITNWPEDIASSRYWGSDGQAEIKRNEAFVRVWRNTLSMAHRTLTDWADPKGQLTDDILFQGQQKNVDPQAFRKKLPVLFGNRKDLFNGNDEDCKTILETALDGLAELRNAAFHFKGIDNFTHALENSPKSESEAAKAIACLWERDEGDNAERVLKDMKAAHFACYFNDDQNQKLFEAVLNTDLPGLPLPRFRRMLARADNAWEGKDSLLPPPANQQELEKPARNCQYQALKLLYERVFPDWLAKQSAEKLNKHIEKAEERANKAAKKISKNELAVWRAAGRLGLQQCESIADFLSRISAETASEMRVQRGYESDPEKARKQAKYLEDMRCDVISLAFVDYLKTEEFDYLLSKDFMGDYDSLDLPSSGKGSIFDSEGSILDSIDNNRQQEDAKIWPKTLYFLLHLVPVDEVSRLRHQIDKWALLEHKGQDKEDPAVKERANLLRRTLTLYQDMHDAKFEGGAGLNVPPDLEHLLASLYEPRSLYYDIFGDAGDDIRIPRRGLREMRRFGKIACLRTVFEKHRISEADVEALQKMEHKTDDKPKSHIAHQQETRTDLHKKWVKDGKNFSDGKISEYKEVLKTIICHRQLSSKVYLKDHVRLHQLLMRILGRLVDYAGLWERDRYFATLGLIYREGLNLNKDLGNKFKKKFKEGGTKYYDAVAAWPEDKTNVLKPMLERYFGGPEDKNDIVRIRNRFAHFGALLPKRNNEINLTDEIKQAREMLSYDRKLKNAVSKSIMDLLHREGLTLQWKKCSDHQLSDAVLDTRRICHLGKKYISEDLHGKGYVAMVADLFGGTVLEGEHRQQAKKPVKSRRSTSRVSGTRD